MNEQNNFKTFEKKETNYPALSTLITVFFFWGFIAAGNSIFIPFCKHKFHLDQFQSQLVDTAFYFAYYVGALFLFILSSLLKKDIVGSWGYKKSIIYGLLFSALGAATMILAVNQNSFPQMLFGLFVVALGFSLQQTSANPFAILLGDPATGNTRINLGGGINSLGTTIGPLVVGLALFGTSNSVCDNVIYKLPVIKVIVLYVCVGILFLTAAALFAFSKKVPSVINNDIPEKANKALISLLILTSLMLMSFIPIFNSYRGEAIDNVEKIKKTYAIQSAQIADLNCSIQGKTLDEKNTIYDMIEDIKATYKVQSSEIDKIMKPIEEKRLTWLLIALSILIIGIPIISFMSSQNKEGWGAMQFPQLTYGMLAIFIYVGVEVAIGSNLGELLKQNNFGRHNASEISPYIAMYWGSLMVGRWTGAIAALSFASHIKNKLKFIIPFIAFVIVLLLTSLAGHSIEALYGYVICITIQVIVAYLSQDKPAKTLIYFSIFGLVAMFVGLHTTGMVSIFAFLTGGLACSIMWPSIFSLAINGLGKYTTQGSAFLIMMILGGAIIPPIQGKLADIIGIHSSFWVAFVCFAFLAWYGYYVGKLFKKSE
jgi:FHS family L-fucose permease-like MFS transporter